MGDTRLIQGRYRLLERIGRGGMGEVWRACDESLGRHVAVKCLNPLGPRHEPSYVRVLRERFRREARVAAALQHRGITVVHDFGESEGVLYLVMELLDGRNLSELLTDNKQHPLPVAEITQIAEQVAAALDYTHRQGVVHRDLKPANVMRLTDGTVKICDFGIARLAHDIGFTARLTGTGVAMGTPHYMSPEQIGGGSVDHRSDLYSLGCVLYELATGAPPFDMDDAWAVLVGHRDTPPRPPRELRPELPAPLERIVLDLLAKDPDDRPPDAADLHARVLRLPSGEPPEPGPARLPGWARALTTGTRALGPGPRPPASHDPGEGLTGVWTGQGAPGTGTGPEEERPGSGGRHVDPGGEATVADGRGGADPGEPARGTGPFESGHTPPEPPVGPPSAALGERHREGAALARAGRWTEAGQVLAAVAADCERALGAEHPDTLAARQEHAYVLGQLGRHSEAHREYAAVLAARERAMGADHPETLRCRHNVAFNLGRLGRLEDSFRMAREVAAARARVLGPQHPDTLVTRCEVGYALGQLGRWHDALAVYRDVAVARQRTLGAEHPDTLAARYEAGICLGRLGRSAEAFTLFRELADERTQAQGADHPDTLRARHCLGVNHGRLGRWEDALAEARDVHERRARVLGADHPDTLVSRREVAVALDWLGRCAEALPVYREVAQARQRVLGADHPDALASRNDEALCLQQLGRSTEAVELHRQVAALSRTSAGRGGPPPGRRADRGTPN
ncbi:tetratricopeptide repeat protein [Streptomyces gamaensis]|uniref:non-specific serine/threonine protein kinase n=1 Tax=Streptomyces gamaensis TaxID=1763542 RepID=A0ABW0Z2L3_9ACTN